MDKTTPGKIGRYEVIRVLGRRGTGEMVLAKDDTLRRRVTIKRLIRPSVASDLARFQVEVKAAAFRHPNMPVVYEMGMHDDLPFIAMEFVEGETLESIIESNRELDLIAKLKIIEQVCTALGWAHRKGIGYGELSPESIIVQANGVVKIMDFGVAKVQEDNSRAVRVDSRVDLLSTAVTLFKLLKGNHPYATGLVSDSNGIINNAPGSPDGALEDLPPSLIGIVRKSLAADPESRYQTGEQLAEALHKVVKELTEARVTELLKDAEQLMAERLFEPALERLDEAMRLAPSNAAVRKRRKSVRAYYEQIRRAERIRDCLRRSDEAFLSGKFDESLLHLRDAHDLDPASEDIQARIRSVEDEKVRCENCSRVLDETERAKAVGDFAAALRLTTNALREDPTNLKLLAMNAALSTQMKKEVRKDRLLELIEQVETDLAAGNYDAAVDLLNEAIEIDPLNQKVGELRCEVAKARGLEQRRAFLEDIQQRIRGLFKQEAYDEASELVNRALDAFPDEMTLHLLKAEVEAEERRYDVRQVVDLVIAEVDELFAHSPLEAMSVLEKALDNMPDEARLVVYELALRHQMESRRPEHSAGPRL